MKTKLLSLFVALICASSLFASDTQVNGIWYDFYSPTQTASVTYRGNSYSSYSNEYSGIVVIPETVTYNSVTYFVTSIGSHAFSGCRGLTSIEIPNSVTTIGEDAFYGCNGLTSVTIPNSVTTIGRSAFRYCSGLTSINVDASNTHYCSTDGVLFNYTKDTLIQYPLANTRTEYTIPNSVTTIGEGAFYGCSGLTSVTIPNSVTTIESSAFYGCSGLTSVAIPNSVTTIGSWAFEDCTSLTSLTIGNSVTTIGNYAFSGCRGLTSVTIPNSVTTIGNGAFENCSGLTSVTIPNSVTTIGGYAFYKCSGLTSITIGNSVTSIEEYAFYNCSGLTSVTIPNSVTSIGEDAFNGCSGLTSITIPNSVKTIRYKAFRNCSGLTSITIPNSVTTIGDEAFGFCSSLTSITIPHSVTSIGGSAFYGCSGLTTVIVESNNTIYDSRENCNAIIETATNTLIQGCKNTTIPNSVTKIGSYAFYGCNDLASITIGNSVTTIGDHAFSYCSALTSVTIGNSVTTIGDEAFYFCSGLNSVTIPNSVTTIGESAFENCSGLTSVTIPNSVTTIGGYAFVDCSGLTSVTIGNSVTTIGELAFAGCTGLTTVTIPNSVTTIRKYAFAGCSSLTSVTIGNSVTTIEEHAFYNCSNLKTVYNNSNLNITKGSTANGYVAYYADNVYNGIPVGDFIIKQDTLLMAYIGKDGDVTIPNGITAIGASAFANCSTLTSITIPHSVTSIGGSAFYGCSGLISVTIPNSVATIGERAFQDCSGLTSVTIGNSVTTIGNYAFYGCSGLTSVTIPNSVTTIGDYVFYGCYGLTSVTIPNSVTTIGNYAFKGCSKLTSITIPNSVKTIGKYAFTSCSGLTFLTIGNSVKTIGKYAFDGCSELTKTNYTGTIAQWCKIRLDSYNANPMFYSHNFFINDVEVKDLVIPEAVDTIEVDAFYGCSGLTSVEISSSVKVIRGAAFGRCSGLTSIEIPSSVTTIAENAFSNSNNITSVIWNAKNCNGGIFGSQVETFVLGDSVEVIPDNLCKGMNKLTTITIPKTVTTIGMSAFSGCDNIKSVTWNAKNCNGWNFGSQVETFILGDSVEVIPDNLCKGMNKLTTITIPKSVTTIGTGAFSSCDNIKTVTWNAKNCNGWNFGNQVETFLFGSEVEKIPANLCKNMLLLQSVVIPSEVTSIGDYAFAGCQGLKQDLVLSNKIVTIGEHAFEGCKNITSVDFSASLDYIGDSAFAGCYRIDNMTCPTSRTPDITEHTFDNVSRYAYLYVLQEHERKFKIDPYWGVFDIKTIGAGGSSTVDDDQVSVDPHDNNADVTWPANSEAEGYSLTITKDGAIFCVLTFNGKGQLTGLAFAPGREGAHPVPAATLSSKGYTFRVTGLDRASKYGLGLDVKDKEEQVIKTYTSAFATTGYVPQNFTIAVNANDNAMGMVTGSGTFEELTSATITAIPNEHYHFVQWNDGNTNNPRQIIVEEDKTYTAIFSIDQHIISATAEHGIVSGAGIYDYGKEVTLTATPNDGYEFVNWNNGVTDNPYTFIVEQNVELTANFKNIETGWQYIHSGINATKYFHNGNLIIERNGSKYTSTGQKVR